MTEGAPHFVRWGEKQGRRGLLLRSLGGEAAIGWAEIWSSQLALNQRDGIR